MAWLTQCHRVKRLHKEKPYRGDPMPVDNGPKLHRAPAKAAPKSMTEAIARAVEESK